MLKRHAPFSILFICFACSEPLSETEIIGETMGTTYRIVVSKQSNPVQADALRTVIETTLERVNAHYSNWDETSEVSLFNASSRLDSIEISEGFQDMLDVSDRVHLATDGRFDLTLTPVIELWGFGPSGTIEQRPSAPEIEAALQTIGQDRVIERSVDGRTLKKTRPDATIYLTAVAKGYGIDAVSQALREIGATDFMVEIGGDLFVSGKTSRDTAWQIGIERPVAGQQGVQDIVTLSNVGMATSGDYRNYFEQDGVRYSHIIDGQTGRPITHQTASVTVIAETALEADAWATALLAVGAEEGVQIAADYDVNALFIVRQNSSNQSAFKLATTPGFEAYKTATEN